MVYLTFQSFLGAAFFSPTELMDQIVVMLRFRRWCLSYIGRRVPGETCVNRIGLQETGVVIDRLDRLIGFD